MGSGSLKAGLQGVSVDQVAQLQGVGGRWWRRRFLMLGLVPRGSLLQMARTPGKRKSDSLHEPTRGVRHGSRFDF
jgi:hypothetical protein